MVPELQLDTAIVELLERREDLRGKVYARLCPHQSGQTVVLDAQPEGVRVFHTVGPECEASHEGLDTSGPECVRVEGAEPMPDGSGMIALALLESGLEPASLKFHANNLVLLCPTHHRLVHEGGFDVQRLDDGVFQFTNPYGVAIRPPHQRETSSPDTIIVQNDSPGLAIDCETATAHWHGERIDYDDALMVTMASWDSGDTRPEAGPAAGDWNPS